jgi:cell wall-associated NlpC family hydrolase
LIDVYVDDHEPYDKGLVDGEDASILPNERLNTLTTNFITSNENTFHFNVIESGPGSKYHCVKAADELNYVVVPEDLKCEPIYPDLVIPPQYVTADNDTRSENTIPLSMVDKIVKEGANTFVKQLSFDYDLLEGQVKKSEDFLGPVNSLDPYPTDDKIEELERHYPKVFIDEIESQIYSCNHPGCPIGQPMAKNFAMLSDAIMNQSKRTEQRLVRLENILSTIMRNQARLGARVNINCVYFGGTSVYNKYACVRCLHDDRIHDGQLCTIDQCLNCTRFEPILGACYKILDESGFNGAIILDDMQMSYSNLNTFKEINTQHIRSPKYEYAIANAEDNCIKPVLTRVDIWKEANKQLYFDAHKNEITNIELGNKTTATEPESNETTVTETESNETTTTESSVVETENGTITTDKTITESHNKTVTTTTSTNSSTEEAGNVSNEEAENISDGNVENQKTQYVDETDYIFRMNWAETFFNHQEPDTKPYPTEGIIKRYKKDTGDLSYDEQISYLDPELDKDTIADLNKEKILSLGLWADTREIAETAQINKYSSEKFYFKGFAEIKYLTNGWTSMNPNSPGGGGYSTGGTSLNTGPGSTISMTNIQARQKICEMAIQIVEDCNAGKAWYSQPYRTTDYNKPNKMPDGRTGYDCSGFLSCCYNNAGLKSMTNKSCSGGGLVNEVVKNGGEMWILDEAGLAKAKPGDVLMTATSKVSASQMGSFIATNHTMVYIGNGEICHASGSKNGIKREQLQGSWRMTKGNHFFMRPADLIAADNDSNTLNTEMV